MKIMASLVNVSSFLIIKNNYQGKSVVTSGSKRNTQKPVVQLTFCCGPLIFW